MNKIKSWRFTNFGTTCSEPKIAVIEKSGLVRGISLTGCIRFDLLQVLECLLQLGRANISWHLKIVYVYLMTIYQLSKKTIATS